MTPWPPSCIMGGMMTMQRLADKVIDLLADSRYTMQDMDRLGFHVVDNSFRGVRQNVLALADSILYHSSTPFDGSEDENGNQYALW